MDIVARVQAIILKPKREWAEIKAEPATVSGLFVSYAMIVAAIPAVFQFLGNTLVGQRLPLIGMRRWPVGRALGNALVTYVFALVSVYLFALFINELAPAFNSAKNMTRALKLAIYSMTPGWLAGVLNIVPALNDVSLLASLYGLYILYLGFEAPMMDTPKERVVGYMAVSIVIVIALYLIFTLLVGGIFALHYGRI